MILERFGKDRHQWLLRQLFHIRQTSSVAAYVDEFFQLVDYYTMKFVDGLRDGIKAVVMLQCPPISILLLFLHNCRRKLALQ
jgi:hypothetical protein